MLTNLPDRFQRFTRDFTSLIELAEGDEQFLIERGTQILGDLVGNDDWLPEEYAKPHPQYYQQYLLYRDPQSRFSVVSFAWGPGQRTPIHNHTVWALIGMLRGAERSERFEVDADGKPMHCLGIEELLPGHVDTVSPSTCDIHRVSNVFEDQVSVSIHVYGGDIGRISRHVFDPATGARKNFISGYSNEAELRDI